MDTGAAAAGGKGIHNDCSVQRSPAAQRKSRLWRVDGADEGGITAVAEIGISRQTIISKFRSGAGTIDDPATSKSGRGTANIQLEGGVRGDINEGIAGDAKITRHIKNRVSINYHALA